MTDKLDVLLADGVIDEVLGRLKSGKEANISLVRRGELVIAAKVYKDRATRSFKNNADYKEGRKVRNSRTQRAIDGGGRFGRDAAEQAWKSAEADALYKLVGSGVRVPAPVMFYEGVLLMDLVCDAEGRPAPRLIDVAIERDAAIGVLADLVAQMISMLCCDLIHGDLSPYNILAAADGPTIIDFPQVVSAVHSSRAEYFFLRDFDNIVRFLAGSLAQSIQCEVEWEHLDDGFAEKSELAPAREFCDYRLHALGQESARLRDTLASMNNLKVDLQGLRGGPLEWTPDNHFRTRQHYRVWRWDTAKNAIVRVQDWQAIEVKRP